VEPGGDGCSQSRRGVRNGIRPGEADEIKTLGAGPLGNQARQNPWVVQKSRSV
jgi:hypothetical protein